MTSAALLDTAAAPLAPQDLHRALMHGPLSQGLHYLGERWTVAILLGAFMGTKRFEGWLSLLGIPRATLSDRLRSLCQLGVLERRDSSGSYHLSPAGLALYDAVLMIWDWERRFGGRDLAMPTTLVHQPCGHAFTPELTCRHCPAPAHLHRLRLELVPSSGLTPPRLPPATRQRGARMGDSAHTARMGLGLRVDRWALLCVAAVMLGCHHFSSLQVTLGVSSAVLARRLAALVDAGLLHVDADRSDARKRHYALTPASHALLGYIVCFDHWAATHLTHCQPTIAPVHADCGTLFVPTTACSHCHSRLLPREVTGLRSNALLQDSPLSP
ncbi:winged helix-turn-helix transcriptional regulator [Curvibacter sp. APW13]|uniref:winged helix-turn-helix transcriptional regulator n=1 Tax=Curvibacter sp. APW13 TaxID=3077236 RepID=UPI0028DDBA3A|nr:winged helix-turn-helix transcriptional regulator [Curvibacter sp. APW13]MDT8989315.1 winged helix-turn-helix transcriptional regulator [Curvibacter sp. APW13]